MDRVDALLAIFDASPTSRTAALLASARVLVGRVLRDVDALESLLAAVSEPALRRAATVALGLLGCAVDATRMLGDAQAVEPLDAAALLLNAVLVHPESSSRVAYRLACSSTGQAATLLTTASIRVAGRS